MARSRVTAIFLRSRCAQKSDFCRSGLARRESMNRTDARASGLGANGGQEYGFVTICNFHKLVYCDGGNPPAPLPASGRSLGSGRLAIGLDDRL
jgi:hypothetical protein